MTVREFAPAKINLTLHVTGRRPDGYHLLDSLVVFASVGDWVHAKAGPAMRLSVTGPRADGVPQDGSNLVLKAAALIPGVPADLTLEKHLPAAAGIGGGSSDAAAALRALAKLGSAGLPPADQVLALGADVPVCLAATPCRMQGIGEVAVPLPGTLPEMGIVLVNPGVDVPTPRVFAALETRDNPAMPEELPRWDSFAAFTAFLAGQRNDLEAPARAVEPVIGDVLAAIEATEGCALSRMSGSGATCYGLYETERAAQSAAQSLAQHTGWWAKAGHLLP